jgi:hypothetical protein
MFSLSEVPTVLLMKWSGGLSMHFQTVGVEDPAAAETRKMLAVQLTKGPATRQAEMQDEMRQHRRHQVFCLRSDLERVCENTKRRVRPLQSLLRCR